MMSDTTNLKELQELIDSFISYRKALVPMQESLKSVSETYEAIKSDVESLSKNFSSGTVGQLEKIHSTLNSQAKSGQELLKKIDEYAASGERYTHAVNEMQKKFAEVAARFEAVSETERNAERLISRLDVILAEGRSNYNLKDLEKSLESYNKNVEKVSDFINKDIAAVLKDNAEKIEAIKMENEELSAAVSEQGKSIAALTSTFAETSALLKKLLERDTVNQEYLYDALDNWAADRKVKTKKK